MKKPQRFIESLWYFALSTVICVPAHAQNRAIMACTSSSPSRQTICYGGEWVVACVGPTEKEILYHLGTPCQTSSSSTSGLAPRTHGRSSSSEEAYHPPSCPDGLPANRYGNCGSPDFPDSEVEAASEARHRANGHSSRGKRRNIPKNQTVFKPGVAAEQLEMQAGQSLGASNVPVVKAQPVQAATTASHASDDIFRRFPDYCSSVDASRKGGEDLQWAVEHLQPCLDSINTIAPKLKLQAFYRASKIVLPEDYYNKIIVGVWSACRTSNAQAYTDPIASALDMAINDRGGKIFGWPVKIEARENPACGAFGF